MLSAAGEITDPARHVDGEETLDMPYGVTRDSNGSCTGRCCTALLHGSERGRIGALVHGSAS